MRLEKDVIDNSYEKIVRLSLIIENDRLTVISLNSSISIVHSALGILKIVSMGF